MLILTRRLGEIICIGDDIKIHVKLIEGNKQVRLGIDAPKDVKIMRKELLRKPKEEASPHDGAGR